MSTPTLPNLHLGMAPDSWGVWFPDDPEQVPWHRFLDEAAATGCTAIELGPFGYLPTEPRTPARRARPPQPGERSANLVRLL